MTSSVPAAVWRKKVLKDTAMLNASALTSQMAALLQSLIVMRLLAPKVYGIWLGLTIILTYGGFAHLGTEHGIVLRIPYLRGKGMNARSGAMADSVFLVWTIATLLIAAGVAVFAAVSNRSPLVRLGLYSIALVLPLNQQANFYARWHGAALTDFRLTSVLSVFQSVVSLLVIVPLVFLFGLRGLMIGAVIVAALVYVGWVRSSSYRFRGRWSVALYWQALRFGLPMTLVVLAGGLIQSIDRIVILSLLGATSLGYYGVTSFGGSILYGLMSQAGSAMSPHITAEMGRSGDSPHSLANFLVVPTMAFSYIATFTIALLMVVIPPIVTVLLPRYSPGLTAFLIYVPGFYFLGVIITANTVLTLLLISRRRQRVMIYVQGIVIALEGGLAFLLIKAGAGLEGAAFASTFAYACYGLSVLVMAARQVFRSSAEISSFLTAVIKPFAVVMPIMLLARWAVVDLLPIGPAVGLVIEITLLGAILAAMWSEINRQIALLPVALELRDSLRARFGPRA